MDTQAQAVLDFWFAGTDTKRREWFQKDDAFDREIERRFGKTVRSIVESCTDAVVTREGQRKPPWRKRKEAYIAKIRTKSRGTLVPEKRGYFTLENMPCSAWPNSWKAVFTSS